MLNYQRVKRPFSSEEYGEIDEINETPWDKVFGDLKVAQDLDNINPMFFGPHKKLEDDEN